MKLERIPAQVRQFGYYPDIALLQAGDLILVSPQPGGCNAKLIRWVQSRWHGADDVEWVHAAMYLGENSIVEIDTFGVGVPILAKYVGGFRIKFRRPKKLVSQNGAVVPQDVDGNEGRRISIEALKNFKTSYGFQDMIATGVHATWRSFVPNGRAKIRTKGSICSDFYCDAVYTAVDFHPCSVNRQPFQPGDLSASSRMSDLDIPWRRLI